MSHKPAAAHIAPGTRRSGTQKVSDMSGIDPATSGTVFEAYWNTRPTWRGNQLYTDLETAQMRTANAYARDTPCPDRARSRALQWDKIPGSPERWELTDDSESTPISITPRGLQGSADGCPALSLGEQLMFASEFRMPLPSGRPRGYQDIAVRRDPYGGSWWAVTDGAVSGLRAWMHDGWRRVSDVGMHAAYRHTRSEALTLGQQVTDIETACQEAEMAAFRPQNPGLER
jgi:hypothetical protein